MHCLEANLPFGRTQSGFQINFPLILLMWTGEHQEQTLSHILSWLLEHSSERDLKPSPALIA